MEKEPKKPYVVETTEYGQTTSRLEYAETIMVAQRRWGMTKDQNVRVTIRPASEADVTELAKVSQ